MVDELFFVKVIPLFVSFVLGPCFVMRYFVSSLVLQSSRWGIERAGCVTFIVFLMSCTVIVGSTRSQLCCRTPLLCSSFLYLFISLAPKVCISC